MNWIIWNGVPLSAPLFVRSCKFSTMERSGGRIFRSFLWPVSSSSFRYSLRMWFVESRLLLKSRIMQPTQEQRALILVQPTPGQRALTLGSCVLAGKHVREAVYSKWSCWVRLNASIWTGPLKRDRYHEMGRYQEMIFEPVSLFLNFQRCILVTVVCTSIQV